MNSTFLNSYIETSLWSSTDEDGIPLDDSKYADSELAPVTRERFKEDCAAFYKQYAKVMNILSDDVVRSLPNESRIAHDFWLTRNRHGAGFWDGDYPEPLGAILTDLAHSFGECDLYVGDDNLIHAF
jgi:hypothetical protein